MSGINSFRKGFNQVDKTKNDLSLLVKVLTKNGETERITCITPQEKQLLFEMGIQYEIYFKTFEKITEGTEYPFVSVIPKLREQFMNLSVSEVSKKEGNLTNIIANIYKRDMEMQNEQQGNKIQIMGNKE